MQRPVVETVHAEPAPTCHVRQSRFHARTGCAVLVSTRFSVRGEPIVCTPKDAHLCRG
jgi:carbamoyltransferase